ncbi:MAG: Wzz/FepE/Etk N-terminal domain-containing protein [Mycobacterium sp.]
MRAPADSPRVRDYLSMLARGWVIILVATVLSIGAAGAAVEVQKPKYQASALVFAEVAGDPGAFSTYTGGMGANARIPTYVDLAQSRLVARRAIEDLKLNTTPEDLVSRVSAEWVPGGANVWGRVNSALLRVTVTDADPDTAVKTANAIAGHLMGVSRELEWTQSKETDAIQYTGPNAELVPIDPARTAELVKPPVMRALAVGGGVGLACSVLLVLGVGIARDRVANRSQLNHIVKQATQAEA